MPTVVEGTSGAIMPVSETTTTSQASRAALGDQQRLEVRAADLLLPLDQELEVDRQSAVPSQQPPGRLDLVQGLALVVDGAAGPALAVDDHRVERRRGPLLERVDRLHVVVAVDQHGRRRRPGVQPVAVDRRTAAGLAARPRAPGRPDGSRSAPNSADARTSAARSGSAEMDGIRSQEKRVPMMRSRSSSA